MNNQFTGESAWEDYLVALENASPAIEVLAVTDYYVTDAYEEVLRHKQRGRLPNIRMVMPNVELRLDVATAKGRFVNLHLLVSPEDDAHLTELQRILGRLQFDALGDQFNCTRADLIRLGRRFDSNQLHEKGALTTGANQFKVNLKLLRDVFQGSDWARRNILVAVAGGSGDGTSGVREAADQVIRQEIEGFAHIIFASGDAQRDFWLGKKGVTQAELRTRYKGPKPCLHGSDAHRLAEVAVPFENRFSWLKGLPHFDALRQACIDPGGRSFIGSEPPRSAPPSQVIARANILDADWARTPALHLNPGLVAIIGARGSGKTALADIIAAGCDAIPEAVWRDDGRTRASFLARALPLISDQSVRLEWEAGARTTRRLDGSDANGAARYPRARYLSQQFVEELCSAHGLTDGLLREIERVIFEAHQSADRDGALDFEELLDQQASRHRLAREREAEAVTSISDRVAGELEKEKMVATLDAQVTEKRRLVTSYTEDRTKLVPKGGEVLALRHAGVVRAAERLNTQLRQYANQQKVLRALQDEVRSLRNTNAPEMLRQAKSRHAGTGMNDAQWADFLLDYKGDVDAALAGHVSRLAKEVSKLKGDTLAGFNHGPIADDADLSELSLAALNAEVERLGKQMNADKEIQRQYAALTTRITTEDALLKALEEKLTDARGAKERVRHLQGEREEAYERAFDALIAEQGILERLYAPLMERLARAQGTLTKLSFSVDRVADARGWASRAEEELIDLRKQGAFKGRGTLGQRAVEELQPAWETGTAADVRTAMTAFRRKYFKDLLDHAPVPETDQVAFRVWLKHFARWLYGTDHIEIRYGIAYEGTDIRKVSPGTRGIILLLLYLALDDADDRPLIIDQPEENLDPKSVYDELVPLFIAAKAKRQVIMVTHNANLVVNTDADQVIVAHCQSHQPGALPPITYTTGGLDQAGIRRLVCDILEGGEEAFRERARRLHIKLGG